uniref:Uncharacterized protein n=1 Tax=Romanomermis culicivorax TaxID=13658 RepID=A0A915JNL7_ROMCU
MRVATCSPQQLLLPYCQQQRQEPKCWLQLPSRDQCLPRLVCRPRSPTPLERRCALSTMTSASSRCSLS